MQKCRFVADYGERWGDVYFNVVRGTKPLPEMTLVVIKELRSLRELPGGIQLPGQAERVREQRPATPEAALMGLRKMRGGGAIVSGHQRAQSAHVLSLAGASARLTVAVCSPTHLPSQTPD